VLLCVAKSECLKIAYKKCMFVLKVNENSVFERYTFVHACVKIVCQTQTLHTQRIVLNDRNYV